MKKQRPNPSANTKPKSTTFSWSQIVINEEPNDDNDYNDNANNNDVLNNSSEASRLQPQSPLAASPSSDMYSQIHAVILLLIDTPLLADDDEDKENKAKKKDDNNAWSTPRNHAQHLSSTTTTTSTDKPLPQSKPTPKLQPPPPPPKKKSEEEEYVYLLPQSYIRNWLCWAYNSYHPRHPSFTADVEEAFVKAGQLYNVDYFENFTKSRVTQKQPGFMDASSLADGENVMILSKRVQLIEPFEGGGGGGAIMGGEALDDAKVQLEYTIGDYQHDNPNENKKDDGIVLLNSRSYDNDDDKSKTEEEEGCDGVVPCCAIPEPCYELLRSVQGVLCDDGQTIAYKSETGTDNIVALHHGVISTEKENDSSCDSRHGTINIPNFVENPNNSTKKVKSSCNGTSNSPKIGPRPIEFRRKVLTISNTTTMPETKTDFASPATKLLKLSEEEDGNTSKKKKIVELYPIKLTYSIVGPETYANHKESRNLKDGMKSENHSSSGCGVTNNNSVQSPFVTYPPDGFALVSRTSSAFESLEAVIKAAVPDVPTSGGARIWSNNGTSKTLRQCKTMGATAKGDGFELVDMKNLLGKDEEDLVKKNKAVKFAAGADGKDKKNGSSDQKKNTLISIEEWVRRHSETNMAEILIEVRNGEKASWPREDMELGNRIKVGDFVDAQDSTGKWYEAVIRNVKENTVKVHYVGWNSRWDCTIPRRLVDGDNPGCAKNTRPPAPLWSHTSPWRHNIAVGDKVEVRESSSIVQRPKWFRATVKAVAGEDDTVREIVGGAELEALEKEEIPSMINGEQSETNITKKRPLLLLNRTRQVLVEVPQEKFNSSSTMSPPSLPLSPLPSTDSSSPPTAKPPFLRWVNLYGEEICGTNTHLEPEKNAKPATIKYAIEPSRQPVEVMKSTMHGAGFFRESIRGVPPAPGSVGLHNLGNSCFLNSVLQCLNHIEPLTRYFLKGYFRNDLNKNNPLGSGGNVALAYSSLLNDMWGGEYSALAPRKLKQTVADFAPQFNNTYQHDSQEFCSFLMDGLHEDLNRVKDKPYVEDVEAIGMEDEKAAIESWRKHLLRHDSIIVDTCQGMHRSHLRCPKCGKESVKYDVYSSISLPLVEKKNGANIPLSECLDKFSSQEELDEENTWYCANCKENVCALKEISLWTTPDILIFHLKRFTFDTCKRRGSLVRSKVDDTVDFPVEGLDMSPYILGPVDAEAPPIYKLFGVSEHTGPTANSGHYTATIRNSQDGKWYRCNDSHVGSTCGEASITKGAYLLFYQRAKGQSKWAGMDKVMSKGNIDPYGALGPDVDGFIEVKSKKKKKKKSSTTLNTSFSGRRGRR